MGGGRGGFVIGVVEVVDIFITYNHQLLQFSWVHDYWGLILHCLLCGGAPPSSSLGLMFWSVLLSKWCPKSVTKRSNNGRVQILTDAIVAQPQ